ncbi:MAG TPA: hypothetical protein VGI30_06830 [Caulobacteraceae bacterium]|jgi:predicted Na+-dependent transporter
MPRYTGRSAFPFKKELAIGTCIWLTYAVPSVILYLHAKGKVANICWAVIAGVTALVILPLLARVWMTWPEADEPDVAPSAE